MLERTISELFEEQVNKTPDHIAVVFEGERITYKELNTRVNVLAHKLRNLGVKSDDYVGIMMERSIEMVVGIYGIIKAGGAYVPLDPNHPKERIEYILEDCKPKALLTNQDELETELDIHIINLESQDTFVEKTENPEIVNQPNELVYLIYTSGTTGKPKGVMVEHRNLHNYLLYAKSAYITKPPTVPLFTNYTFDLTVTSIFLPLISGGKLVVYNEEIHKDIENIFMNKEITFVKLTPSQLKMALLLEDVEPLEQLETLILGGEELDAKTSHQTLEKYGKQIKIHNEYGPTETTIGCCDYVYQLEDNAKTAVSIGYPISNTQIYIMDRNRLSRIGRPGELCIAGEGVARGYFNKPELTNEKFVDNPYGEGKLYRTGDLAKWLPDGRIEYLGRIDDQVKIRGFRIELGEIESAIRRIEKIVDAVAIVREDKNGEKAIYAYFISKEGLDIDAIQDQLRRELSEYMIPSYMKQIEQIPVTSNGKLDRRALPDIEIQSKVKYVAPRNEIEAKICEAFSEVLDISQIGIYDNFFQIGGHSLKAVSLVNLIEQKVNAKLSLNDILQARTPIQITVIIEEKAINVQDVTPVLKNDEKIVEFENINDIKLYLEKQMNEFETAILDGRIVKQYPISDMQMLSKQMGLTYSGMIIEFNHEIDVERLNESIKKIIDSQGLLRSTLIAKNDEVMIAEFEPDLYKAIPYVNISQESEEIKRGFIQYVVKNIYGKNKNSEYGLYDRLLYNMIILKEEDKKYRIYMPFNHLIFDGMSIEIIKSTLRSAYYRQEPNNTTRLAYEDYIKQINKGPQGISEDQLIDTLDLVKFNESMETFLEKDYHFKNTIIKLSIDEGFKSRNQGKLWNIASQLFIKVMKHNFNRGEIPVFILHTGRHYEDQNYYHTIGEFIDMIPFHLGELEDDFTKISDRLQLLGEKNINFITLINNKKLNHSFPKIKKLFNISNEELIKFPSFNYLGLYETDETSEEILMSDWEGAQNAQGRFFNIAYREKDIYITTFCNVDDLETLTEELQDYINAA
ncbi:MAG: amino acid adenylation domain-containing protein [Defluviitaleaceae bacterium]|nr:amino acid adenylation domain-containing protein [Defluviitaleaceae bacterium]